LLICEVGRAPVLTWSALFEGDAAGIDFLGLILGAALYNGKL